MFDLVNCWKKQSDCLPLPPRCLFPFQAFVHKWHLTAIDHTWEGTVAAGRRGLHEPRNKLWSCRRVQWCWQWGRTEFLEIMQEASNYRCSLWPSSKKGTRSQFHLDCGPEGGNIVCGIREMGNAILLLRRLKNSGFVILRLTAGCLWCWPSLLPIFLLGCGKFWKKFFSFWFKRW